MLLIAIAILILVSLFVIHEERNSVIAIEYWTHADEKRFKLEERLIDEFEAQYPDIKIERRIFSSSELLDYVPSAIEAGSGPVLFNLPSEEISAMLFENYLSPLDTSLVDVSAYIDGAFDAVTYSGHIYGIPLEYTNWCLYVNRAMLEEKGFDLPRTWEDIVKIAEALSEHDGMIISKRIFDFRYPYYLSFFVPMVEQLGGSLFGPDGTPIYNEEAWREALSFMQEWGPNGLNLGSPTYVNARTLFNDEGIAMCLSGLYQEERMKEENPEFYDSDRWCIVPFPIFENAENDVSSSSYLHFFLVNANASPKERRAGWLLASFFAEHAEAYLDEVGLMMPLKRILESDKVLEKPYGNVFLDDLRRSHAVYSGPFASEIQSLIGDAVNSVMLHNTDPEKAVASLKAAIGYLFST